MNPQDKQVERTQHTPGPWRSVEIVVGARHGYYDIRFQNSNISIAKVSYNLVHVGLTKDEAKQNARLIAAAPEYHAEAYILAMEVLQSDLYAQRPNVKRIVDGLLALREEVNG